MLDMKFVRNNPDAVKENIKKKFQDEKLPLVDEVLALDKEFREAKGRCDELRGQVNSKSKMIGGLMKNGDREGAEAVKAEVVAINQELKDLEAREEELQKRVREIMLVIPNIIDESVPIGKDDSENVEVARFGEPFVPEFEVPYHVDIMEKLGGIDIDAADIPDLVPIMAAVAAVAEGKTTIYNAERLRLKESDRLKTVSETLNILGADVSETDDGLVINGKPELVGGTVNASGDHRIAMMAAIAALRCKNEVIIENAEAVNKSYPAFFEDYNRLSGKVEYK